MRGSVQNFRPVLAGLVACVLVVGLCTAALLALSPAATTSSISSPTTPHDQPLRSGFTYPPRPTRTPLATDTPWPTRTSSLPALAPWGGSEILKLASGVQANLIGVGPDGAVAILEYVHVGDRFKGTVFSIRRDGTPKPGWPAGGVPVPDNPVSEAIDRDGTVYVATGAVGISDAKPTSLVITAIRADGTVLPGWPYTSPAALHDIFAGSLVVGPHGQACFMDFLPGSQAQNLEAPSAIYCVGADGRLLPGWPYTSPHPMLHPAFGADGTLYVEQTTQQSAGRYEIVALGADGKPKTGWTPWKVKTLLVSPIVAAPDGRVNVMILGLDEDHLVTLGADGSLQGDRVLDFPAKQLFSAMATAPDGTLYVSTCDDGPLSLFGTTGGHISAFGPDGSARPGWPAPADGPNKIYLSPDGSVWTTWEIWTTNQRTGFAVAAFDPNGKLRAGFPMAMPDLGSVLAFDSSGTAYAIMATNRGTDLVAIAG